MALTLSVATLARAWTSREFSYHGSGDRGYEESIVKSVPFGNRFVAQRFRERAWCGRRPERFYGDRDLPGVFTHVETPNRQIFSARDEISGAEVFLRELAQPRCR